MSTDGNKGITSYKSVRCTSCVAERFEVEGQLLHTLPGLLIMLRVLRTGNQGNWLSLRNLQENTGGQNNEKKYHVAIAGTMKLD